MIFSSVITAFYHPALCETPALAIEAGAESFRHGAESFRHGAGAHECR